MDRLSTRLGDIELRSPLLAASGTVGNVADWADVGVLDAYGAAVAKSVSPVEWPGRMAPRLAPTEAGMLNGIGIQNPGVEAWVETIGPLLGRLAVEVWGSAVGNTPDDFALVSKRLADAGVPVVELNLSCPNLEDGEMFALDPRRAAEVVETVVGEVPIPVGAKLSPNAVDIVSVAGSCVAAGAAFLTLTNTVLGFGVDPETRRPLLASGEGGYSGPGLKPIAMRCVYQVAQELPGVPIIGCGGVSTGRDVVEYLIAGASAVALGTIHLAEPRAGGRIRRQLIDEMDDLEVDGVADLVGTVRRW